MPVVLATVKSRSVLAQDANTTLQGSGCASFAPSGWLQRDGEEAYDLRYQDCQSKGYIDEFGNPSTPSTTESVGQPTTETTPPPPEN